MQRVTWTETDLKHLLDGRAAIAARQHNMDELSSVTDLLPRTNQTRGDPLHYILSRTLLRPRDAISFFNECFAIANGREKLTWAGIKSAEIAY